MLVSDAIIRCLKDEGVTTVFGGFGCNAEPMFDALKSSVICLVSSLQGDSAGYAALGYSRACGKAAVCLTGGGQASLKLLTAIAAAQCDCIPMVVITGQVPSSQLGRDVKNEADITGAAQPFVKHSYLARDASQVPRILKEAFYLAGSGRKGPVLVDVPLDIQQEEINYSCASEVQIRGYSPILKGNMSQIKRFAQVLSKARKPLMLIGGGVFASNACAETFELSRKLDIPVVSMLSGYSAVPADVPLYIGCIEADDVVAELAVESCDVLLVVGARFLSSKYRLEDKTVLHVDIDPAEIGKNLSSDLPLVGDCKFVMKQLYDFAEPVKHISWRNTLRGFAKKYSQEEDHSFDGLFINGVLMLGVPDTVVCDCGKHLNYIIRNRFLSRAGNVMIPGMNLCGFGIAAAIGAAIANEGTASFCVCDEEDFVKSLADLAAVNRMEQFVQGRAAIRVLLINCRSIMRYKELAELFSLYYVRVETDEFDFDEALDKSNAALIDIKAEDLQ